MPRPMDQHLPPFEAGPLPTVLLRHDLADGTHHVDWMISQNSAGTLPLITFRLDQRLDELEAGQSVPATRLEDHRPLYLDYEGPISGNRGTVKRLSYGQIKPKSAIPSLGPAPNLELEVQWKGLGTNGPSVAAIQLLRLKPEALASQWTVFCVTIELMP